MTVTPEQLTTAIAPVLAKLDGLETSGQAMHSRIDKFGYELHGIRDSMTSLGDDLRKVTEQVFGDGGTAPVRYVLTELTKQIEGIQAERVDEKKAREAEEKAQGRGRIAIATAVISGVGAFVTAIFATCAGGV